MEFNVTSYFALSLTLLICIIKFGAMENEISCCVEELNNYDLTSVGPIHQKRTLAFLNHFLIETTSFLNNFATVCDGKLEDMLQRIQRLEASICILENKLASIPGLENIYQDTETQDTTSSASETTTKISTNSESPKINEGVPTTVATVVPVETTITTEPVKEVTTPKGVPYSKDARYAKYFKMVSMGVPAGAVKLKMTSEGVDANILEKPDEIAPDSPPITEETQSDDNSDDSSEFSD